MDSTSASGTQLIGRATAVLRAVSAREPDGIRTSDVATATGLARPTAHRILSALAADGYVDQQDTPGLWHLGPELYLLGQVAADRYDITAAARDVVRGLAHSTGESAFLSARRGDETVCLIRIDGPFPLRSHVLYEGLRLPLGVASAGLAILSFLPDATVDRFLDRHDLTAQWGPTHAPAPLRERILETRATGYAVNPGLLVEGSWGMGAAVFDKTGNPAWALSLTGVEARFSPSRRAELGRLLLEAAHVVTQRAARR